MTFGFQSLFLQQLQQYHQGEEHDELQQVLTTSSSSSSSSSTTTYRRPSVSSLCASAESTNGEGGDGGDGGSADPNRPKNLADQATFIKAVDAIKSEISKQLAEAGVSPNGDVNVDSATAATVGGTNTATSETLKKKKSPENEEGVEVSYAVGRLQVTLGMDQLQGMDLTESTGGLVLMTAISQGMADLGIYPFDTIVGVTAAGKEFPSINAVGIDQTAKVLQEACGYAVDKGETSITLEINRLIMGYYK